MTKGNILSNQQRNLIDDLIKGKKNVLDVVNAFVDQAFILLPEDRFNLYVPAVTLWLNTLESDSGFKKIVGQRLVDTSKRRDGSLMLEFRSTQKSGLTDLIAGLLLQMDKMVISMPVLGQIMKVLFVPNIILSELILSIAQLALMPIYLIAGFIHDFELTVFGEGFKVRETPVLHDVVDLFVDLASIQDSERYLVWNVGFVIEMILMLSLLTTIVPLSIPVMQDLADIGVSIIQRITGFLAKLI